MTNELHVVLGAGAAGLTLAETLHRRGHRVRVVNRSAVDPNALPGGLELTVGDVSKPGTIAELAAGAATIYNATHAPYEVWDTVLPVLQEAVIAGAAATGAKLVVLDTLYPYGPTGGQPMTERTPQAAATHKGSLRTKLTERYLAAHSSGEARIAIGRAADFFGPRVFNSALGATVFPQALAGQPVLAFGDIDLPHSYGYIKDVAPGLATLGEHESAGGRVWHLPVVPAVSTRQIHDLIAAEIGRPLTVDLIAEPKPYGPFDEAFMREYEELFYQYTEPQIVVSSAIEEAFGLAPTPLAEAIATTVAWYRALDG